MSVKFFTADTPIDDAVLNVIAHLPTESLARLAEPAFFRKMTDGDFMRVATWLAQKSFQD